jgi:uncharacterized protein (TIGR02646 family)
MIRVVKDRSLAPAKWLEQADREAEANKRCFDGRGRKKGDPSFRAFKAKELRRVLNRIFSFKCAYCEAPYGATQPVAVEHYRPKGPVTEGRREIPPGYYWLAADWTNLFPSCTDCNSQRSHEFSDGPKTRGKANQFPLLNPQLRAKAPGGERREKPLLLNPCQDRPEKHLEFLIEPERFGLVRPARDARGRDSARGRCSIEIYALDRPGLIERRRSHAKRVENALAGIRRTVEHLGRYPRDRQFMEDLKRSLDEFTESFLAADKEFLGMVRSLVNSRIRALIRRRPAPAAVALLESLADRR